jgi:hypothetical protein
VDGRCFSSAHLRSLAEGEGFGPPRELIRPPNCFSGSRLRPLGQPSVVRYVPTNLPSPFFRQFVTFRGISARISWGFTCG